MFDSGITGCGALGFAPARIAIGRLYESGQGTRKDADEAAIHYLVAAATVDRKRSKQEEEAFSRLEKLAQKMGAARVEAARKRADEWVRTNGG